MPNIRGQRSLIEKDLLARENFNLYESCVESGATQFSFNDFVRFEKLENIEVINNNDSLAVISLIGDELEIYFIGVKRELRNQGVGKKFLRNIIKLAKDRSATSVILEVNEKNTIALNIYRSLNFIGCGIRKNYYYKADGRRDNALIMRLKLKAVT